MKTATSYAEVQATLIAADYTWDNLMKLRDRWPGHQNLYDDWANFLFYSLFFIIGMDAFYNLPGSLS